MYGFDIASQTDSVTDCLLELQGPENYFPSLAAVCIRLFESDAY